MLVRGFEKLNVKDVLLEALRKWLVVQEDVRILKLPVEPILDLLHAAHDTGKV